MAIETDRCRLLSGVRHGRTLGSPISLVVENTDFCSWSTTMSVAPLDAVEQSAQTLRAVTVPRPGHADLSGIAKYDFSDARNVLERASARETVGRVAGGAICRRLLREAGVTICARVISIGPVRSAVGFDYCLPDSVDWLAVEASPVGCDDSVAGEAMCRAIDEARANGESLGGVFEVWCWGVCPGVGGYDRPDARLDGRLLGALGSIPAIKGVEIGNAFGDAERVGSEVHDPMVVRQDVDRSSISRDSNRAGGLEGGMTNGMPVILRAAMKPIPTLTTPLASVELPGLSARAAHVERSDVTAVPAARVVGEAMAAYVLASSYLEKFGGDSLADFLGAIRGYEARLESRGLWHRS
jgi:chorismate synthase